MSEHIQRMRALQRAKTAERLTRVAAERAFLALAEFASAASTDIGKPGAVISVDDLDEMQTRTALARQAALAHADAAERLAEVQS